MKTNKIVSMITVIVFLLSFMVLPANAAIDANKAVLTVVGMNASAGNAIEVEVKGTLTTAGFVLNILYDATYLTYDSVKQVAATGKNFKVLNSVVDGANSYVQVEYVNLDGVDIDNAVAFSVKFNLISIQDFLKLGVATLTTKVNLTYDVNATNGDAAVFKGDGASFAKENITINSGDIVIANEPTAPTAAPTLSNSAPKVGDVITATSGYSDINGDAESGTTFEWFADGVSIAAASTTNTYTVTKAELGKKIKVSVVPKTTVDPKVGTATPSAETAAVIANVDLKPTASNVYFETNAKKVDKITVGKAATVRFDFDCPNGLANVSPVEFFVADAADGEFAAISGEGATISGSTITVDKTFKGKFIKAKVTPKSENSTSTIDGTPVESAVLEVKVVSTGGGGTIGGATLPPVDGSTPSPSPSPSPSTSPSPSPSTTPNPGIEKFKDVPKANYGWAVDAIDALAKDGIIKGITEDKFEPETKTTKAQLVAMIMRALNLVDDSATTTLVKADYWGFKEIASAKKLGVLDFYGDKFDADSVISREDMATVIAGAAKAAKITIPSKATAENFKDASSISSYAADAIKALQQAGIINGMGDGTFAPKGETTRAQAAKVIDAVRKLK